MWHERFIIGCVVHDTWARARCRAVIEEEGMRAVDACPEALENPARHAAYAAIVYDLWPWDASSDRRLQHLRQVRPDVPVLLFFPPRPDAFEAISGCMHLRHLRFRVQTAGEPACEAFRRDVRWLVRSIPQEQMAVALHQSLRHLGPVCSLTARITLRYLASGRRPRVVDIGRELRLSSRTLQRRFSEDLGVGPKQFIDLVTVWYVRYVARMTNASWARVARNISMQPDDYYRLARRVLDTDSTSLNIGILGRRVEKDGWVGAGHDQRVVRGNHIPSRRRSR